MVSWTAFRREDAAWDAALARVDGANAFQTAAWARHKADFGWRPVRALAGAEDAPAAAIQALVKDFPGGTRVLWSRGGPVGDPELWNADLRAALVAGAAGGLTYARVCSYRELDGSVAARLAANGWTRPERPLDRNRTYLLNLAPDEETLKASLSSNWRHNLKRGEARAPVSDWADADPGEMEALYLAMESLKGLPPQHRADELGSLARALGTKMILKRAVVDGRTVALRACAVFGTTAIDLLAAATAEARKVYASHALLWTLIVEARRRGAKSYDLGGADPDAARGVADFKGGVGAKPIETVGEWDFARPGPLRRAAGALIAWKLGKGA